MEDLISAFPEDFFPEHGLLLKGRQQVFAGVGRFDLLFVDRYGTNVLMELKAVTAKYENATQLAKYKEALTAQGERSILMWLVAPTIPTAVREFLDRIGIEYSEIHEVQFRRVADRHGVSIAVDPVPTKPVSGPAGPRVSTEDVEARINDYGLLPTIDKHRLERLVHEFEAAAKRRIDKSLGAKLRRELLDPTVPSITRSTTLQLARWCKTDNPLYGDGMAVAQKISELLFGVVLDRRRLGT